MANTDDGTDKDADVCDVLAKPITNKTPEAQKLKAARLSLATKSACLKESQAELDLKRDRELQCAESMRTRGCDVHNTFLTCEKDGVQVFDNPSHNLIAAVVVVKNLKLPTGTLGAEDFKQIQVLMQEAAAQQTMISTGRSASAMASSRIRPTAPSKIGPLPVQPRL